MTLRDKDAEEGQVRAKAMGDSLRHTVATTTSDEDEAVGVLQPAGTLLITQESDRQREATLVVAQPRALPILIATEVAEEGDEEYPTASTVTDAEPVAGRFDKDPADAKGTINKPGSL